MITMDLPTPDTVLMDAMFEDAMADQLIEEFKILHILKKYSGVPIVWYNHEMEEECYRKNTHRISQSTIAVINRKLHQFGWHMSAVENPRELAHGFQTTLYTIDKYNPPPSSKPSKGFLERLGKAWRILFNV